MLIRAVGGRIRAQRFQSCRHTAQLQVPRVARLEPSERYISTIRKLTELVMLKPSPTGLDEYSGVFESIGIQKVLAEGILDLQQRLRADHPRLRRAGRRCSRKARRASSLTAERWSGIISIPDVVRVRS